jgi:hypothetical protein
MLAWAKRVLGVPVITFSVHAFCRSRKDERRIDYIVSFLPVMALEKRVLGVPEVLHARALGGLYGHLVQVGGKP